MQYKGIQIQKKINYFMSVGMKLNDLSESRKMLKLLKENRHEPRPPRSYSEFSKSPKEKKHSFEKPNITQ